MPRVALTIGVLSKAVPYVKALKDAGLEVDVVMAGSPLTSLDGYDGLVLGGGRDVDPRIYGESPLDATDQPDEPRDSMECRLLDDALRRDAPILAICRGVQLLNVHLGGTLHQHIEGHSKVVHPVVIDPDSLLSRAAGATAYTALSRHHQSLKQLAPGARITATAPDSTIEAIEFDGPRFLLAVQWHPEDQFETSPHDRALFEAFARALS
ncbi:MAG TPA: gamma-glutamyl-gamma-aminobutyrate hydrolase family protein [Bryobacteraceae bacterium]|nr:gamma-glutamyl-gamma-aminobutyrate hydrolase family protein [Bryobacteraceae bacterium]HPT25316.1 gamma-glutamyl-gamma-aminobutyrate hydrolase family protein [Bryobacteraceae bacterium]